MLDFTLVHHGNFDMKIHYTLFICFLLSAFCSTTSVSGASDEAGTAFFESVVDDWEDTLMEAPVAIVHSKLIGENQSYFDYWYQESHHLYSYDDGSGSGFWNFSNPEYCASVSFSLAGQNIGNFKRGKLPLGDYRLSPFYSTSVTANASIPSLYKSGDLEITEFQESANSARITFSPTEKGAPKIPHYVVVEFAPERSTLPVSVNQVGKDYSVGVEFLKFEEIKGYTLPTKVRHSQSNLGQAVRTSELKVEYFPDDQLDCDRCFLEYYDLAKPDFSIASRGPKGRVLYWLTLVGTLGVTACVCIFYFRRKASLQ